MKMKTVKAVGTLVAVAAAFFQSGCSVLQPDSSGNEFTRAAYAVIGGGVSRLDPDSSSATGVDVNDRVNGAGQIAVGADLSRQLSVELHAADLGSAGLSANGGNGGRIEYQMAGASALIYAGKNRHHYKRQGLTAFGRLGVSVMENNSIGSAQFRNENSTSLLVGGGVEYATRFGLGLRAEAVSFDEDAQYAQLGLIYRLGKKRERRRSVIAAVDSATDAAIAPVAAVAVPSDANKSEPDESTTITDMVLFASNSDRLDSLSKSVLDAVAETVAQRVDSMLYIRGHADSTGPSAHNQLLSKRRATTVANYLLQHGLSPSQLKVEAYGEQQPVDTNATRAGRQKNRRVEVMNK